VSQWREAANRGALNLHLFTRERLRRDGVLPLLLRDDCEYLGVIEPLDGLPGFALNFFAFANVGAWIREMRPCQLQVFVGTGEDRDTLREALDEFARSTSVAQ
jgi:hypothetical protein